jgi:surface antigen
VFALLLTCAACAGTVQDQPREMAFSAQQQGLDPTLVSRAVSAANSLKAMGRRVWCVPFARNASGIEIRGNANTWWDQAGGTFDRAHQPQVGAVMAFSGTRKLPMGHVAVVSKVVSAREIEVDHANWVRNRISLGMTVVDVSDQNDWSQVRVESTPGQLGRIYPVDGFIMPARRDS